MFIQSLFVSLIIILLFPSKIWNIQGINKWNCRFHYYFPQILFSNQLFSLKCWLILVSGKIRWKEIPDCKPISLEPTEGILTSKWKITNPRRISTSIGGGSEYFILFSAAWFPDFPLAVFIVMNVFFEKCFVIFNHPSELPPLVSDSNHRAYCVACFSELSINVFMELTIMRIVLFGLLRSRIKVKK